MATFLRENTTTYLLATGAQVSSRGPSEETGSMCVKRKKKERVLWTKRAETNVERADLPNVKKPG